MNTSGNNLNDTSVTFLNSRYLKVNLSSEYKEEICPYCNQKVKVYTGNYFPKEIKVLITSKGRDTVIF
jgi:hypothetical protein